MKFQHSAFGIAPFWKERNEAESDARPTCLGAASHLRQILCLNWMTTSCISSDKKKPSASAILGRRKMCLGRTYSHSISRSRLLLIRASAWSALPFVSRYASSPFQSSIVFPIDTTYDSLRLISAIVKSNETHNNLCVPRTMLIDWASSRELIVK